MSVPANIILMIDAMRPLLVTNNDSPSRPAVVVTAVQKLAAQLGIAITPTAAPPPPPSAATPPQATGDAPPVTPVLLQVFVGGKMWIEDNNVIVAFGHPDPRRHQLTNRGFKPDPRPTGFRWKKECTSPAGAKLESTAIAAVLAGAIANGPSDEGQPTKV